MLNSISSTNWYKPLATNKLSRFGSLNIAFNGDIFVMGDSHQHTNNRCRLLSEIERRAKKESREKFLVLDCGDYNKGPYSREAEVNSITKFMINNPNVEFVMTLGNNEIDLKKDNPEAFLNDMKKLSSSGVRIVSANYQLDHNSDNKYIKPYTVINKNGKKIFITGLCVINRSKFHGDQTGDFGDNGEKVVNKVILPGIRKEKPDSIIILNHNCFGNSIELKLYLEDKLKKEDVPCKNVDFIVGGHVHRYYDVPPFYYPVPRCQGMGEFSLKMDPNTYNKIIKDAEYDAKSIEPEDKYKSIIENDENEKSFNQEIANIKADLRIPAQKLLSPSPLGTLIADGFMEKTGADVGLMLRSFVRGEFPEPGKITRLDLLSTFNLPRQLVTLEMTPAQLRDILNQSIYRQNLPIEDGYFIEHSKNLKITRKVFLNENDDNPIKKKVVQIHLKNPETNVWEPLLDEHGRPLEPNRKIKVATDSYTAKGSRVKHFKSLESKPFLENGKAVEVEDIIINGLKRLEQNNINYYPPSKIQNIYSYTYMSIPRLGEESGRYLLASPDPVEDTP